MIMLCRDFFRGWGKNPSTCESSVEFSQCRKLLDIKMNLDHRLTIRCGWRRCPSVRLCVELSKQIQNIAVVGRTGWELVPFCHCAQKTNWNQLKDRWKWSVEVVALEFESVETAPSHSATNRSLRAVKHHCHRCKAQLETIGRRCAGLIEEARSQNMDSICPRNILIQLISEFETCF